MIYVGLVVKFIAPHLGWFDRLLAYRPGFRRYLFAGQVPISSQRSERIETAVHRNDERLFS